MKIMRKSWKLISVAVVIGMLGALIPVSMAMAGSLSSITVSPTSAAVSTQTTYTINFTTSGAMDGSDTITVSFPSAYTVPNGQTTGVTVNDGAAVTGTSTSSSANNTVIFTLDGAESISGSTAVTMTIASASAPTNPATAGSYAVYISTKSDGTAVIDTGYDLVNIGSGTSASVTVKTYISVTISDEGNDGVQFGEVVPNTNNNPDVAQSTGDSNTPSVTITAGSENNVSVDIEGKIDAAWSGTWATADTSYGLDTYDDTETSYTTSYADIKTSVSASGTAKLWHFIDMPSGAAAGTQQNTLYYQATAS